MGSAHTASHGRDGDASGLPVVGRFGSKNLALQMDPRRGPAYIPNGGDYYFEIAGAAGWFVPVVRVA
jgi:hypothetical protein